MIRAVATHHLGLKKFPHLDIVVPKDIKSNVKFNQVEPLYKARRICNYYCTRLSNFYNVAYGAFSLFESIKGWLGKEAQFTMKYGTLVSHSFAAVFLKTLCVSIS
jgi:hypothetical protein